MLIKRINDIDFTEETNNVIKNIKEFYAEHKDECKKYYNLSKNTNDIYFEKTIDNDSDREAFNKKLIETSIVIITANEYEKNILHMRSSSKEVIHYQLNCFNNEICQIEINAFFLIIKDNVILHLEASQTGSYTIGGSADLVRFVFDNPFLNPQCIISFGICFGNDYKNVSIGDTIIAKKLYPYFISAKINESELTVSDDNIFEIDKKLETRLKYLKEKGYFSDNNVKIGNLITGEAVISNALIKKIFIEAATHQPVLGGEMEGYGLFKECQSYRKRLPCLLVKSICDWGAAKNINEIDSLEYTKELSTIKDELQAFASYKAYDILEKLLDKESRLFKISLFEHIVNEIKLMKISHNKAITTHIFDDLIKTYIYNTDIVNKEYRNLCLKLLEEKNIIQKSGNVYIIL